MTTVVCVASGPSFTEDQAAQIVAAHEAGKCRVIVVNNNWRRVPNADVLYAADAKWWIEYIEAVRAGFSGECWTRDLDISKRFGLCWIKSKPLPGLSKDPALIHEGKNSGYQSVGLARHFLWQHSADDPNKTIALVGFDMMPGADGRAHWFGNHPQHFGNAQNIRAWAPLFDQLCTDLAREGVKLLNCSGRTALSVPRADLAAVLEAA